MRPFFIGAILGFSTLLTPAIQTTAQAQNYTVGDKWQPHIDLEGKPGTKRSLGETDLFLPLWQDDDTLLFGSFRARMDDNDSREGNFGLALREMLDSGWNIGGYGYFDHRKSPYGNSFNQATLGLEALSFDWDLRANTYLPFGRTEQYADEVATADFTGASLVYRAGIERAMKGFDAEIGWRVPIFEDDANQQLRIYGGGYRFTDDIAKTVQGPRGRFDLTFDETPFLWAGSRLSIGAEIQHDDPRGTQSFALFRLRIPLQNFGEKSNRNRPKLNAMERRMTDPIIRDVDIVAQAGAFGAPETITKTGDGNDVVLASSDTTIGSNLDNVVSGAANNATIILSGTFTGANSVIDLKDGQTLMGKGLLQIQTPSGRTVTIETPGASITTDVAPATLNGRNTAISMGNNSRLVGVTINMTTNAGLDPVAVQVDGATNVEITGNTFNITANNQEAVGIWVNGGSSNVKIRNNAISAKVTSGTAATFGLLLGDSGAGNSSSTTFSDNSVTVTNGSSNNLVGYGAGSTNNTVSGSNNTGNTNQCSGASSDGSTISFTNGTSC
ncbi:inverse autotransporter beta domain-containing protein [Thalassospira sp. MCCC 1A02491]|uniref:inverse autotransporter beta domain-containing protein n=1 Tax=Thalassospira sp. MCCC 1A02491 TaxID=1769751 RepID=UPI0007AD74FA|nr:inverse autotransporter beta domain-containing protein [Thalassospira sp. MCCC 1A02491]KZB60308.1 hypothetical protein AUQ42_06190 [Thalassospira sp. MCCC 1A02491]